jgi:large subunit ribosomal protein L3
VSEEQAKEGAPVESDAEGEGASEAEEEEAEALGEEEALESEEEDSPLSAPGILGRKLGMTQIFSAEGDRVAVSVIEAGPCVVVQVKTREKDGYEAIQLGFGDVRPKQVNKPRAGHFSSQGVEPTRILREIRLDESLPEAASGKVVTCESFEIGELVDVTGTSKGRGFTGVMKRHNFAGAPASHGTHEKFRHGGSIGAAATPSRVFKGKKMPGQMGNARVTVQNIKIVRVLPEQNLLMVLGSVPGPNGGYVVVRKSLKATRRAKAAH